MIAFEILVNGVRVCVAGASGVLAAGVNWTHHEPMSFRVPVVGLDQSKKRQHAEWDIPPVHVGDEVTIRIIATEIVDPPSRTVATGKRYSSAPDPPA